MTRDQLKTGAWSSIKGFLSLFGAAVFGIGFLMTVLGWRFTGNSADIQAQGMKLDSIELRVMALERRDAAAFYMTCGMFQKLYPDAPIHPECAVRP